MDGKPHKGYEGSKDRGKLVVAIDFTGREEDMIVYKHHLAWWVETIVIK